MQLHTTHSIAAFQRTGGHVETALNLRARVRCQEVGQMAGITLREGIKILGLGSVDEPPGAVELSAGIVAAHAEYPQLPYWKDAFVPKLPWRPPSCAERDLLLTSGLPFTAGMWVSIVRAPQDLFAAFEPFRYAAAKATHESQLDRLRKTTYFAAAVEQASAYARSLLTPDSELRGGDVIFNAKGLPTTANIDVDHLLGLHTDTMSPVLFTQRRQAPVRLCINFGLYERFLLFVNLDLEQLRMLMTSEGHSFEEAWGGPVPSQLRTAFMAAHREYPVVKVQLKPGDAYIAPTENMIHDGSSPHEEAFDVTFQAHGFFRAPTTVEPAHAISA